MKFVFDPFREALRRQNSTPAARFAGAPTAKEAKAQWRRVYTRILASNPTPEEATFIQEAIQSLRGQWQESSRRVREAMTEAFLDDKEELARKLRATYLKGQREFRKLKTLEVSLAKASGSRLALFQEVQPSDELVAAMGYELELYGMRGSLTYGRDWFYRCGDPQLYSDDAMVKPIPTAPSK